jgi:hypothetical protein
MPLYLALIHTIEVDWSQPEFTEGLREYVAFQEAHAAVLRGGYALYPTATATCIRFPSDDAVEPIISDGPYAETKEAITGYYLMECADLDEAIAVGSRIPAARYGTIEIRPVHPSLGV